jgi:hypothetical protein
MERIIRDKQAGMISRDQARQLVGIVNSYPHDDAVPHKAERLLVEFVGEDWDTREDLNEINDWPVSLPPQAGGGLGK